MDSFLKDHSGELTILILAALVLGTLLVLVPRLLHWHLKALEWKHEENLRALEQGLPLEHVDERSLFARRTALLVPMVALCAAGTVTCLVAANRSENVFSVSTAVWVVAGIVSLAAITGSFTLMRLIAQLEEEEEEKEVPKDSLLR
jgi:hypothetical protein